MEDYYKCLGVSENASQDAIKKAFRKLSLKHHPDRGGDGTHFKKINEAYQTLGEPEKRQMYNMQRNSPFGGMFGRGGGDMGDVPDMPDFLKAMLFGGMGGPPGIHRQNSFSGMGGPGMPHVQIFRNGRPMNVNSLQKPEPIVKTIKIKLEQAYTGITYPLQIERWIVINNVKRMEKEKVYVKINKGVDSGEIIIIEGKGNVLNERIKGDIKLFINIENNTNLKREGLHLKIKKEITLKESLTGFKFDIKHLNGKTYTINNDSGNIIPSNYTKEIPKLGMTREGITGKLIIQFSVIFPEKLTEEQILKLKDIL